MLPTLSLIRREFSAYFYSPIAYVILVIFLFATGYLFYSSLTLLTETGPRGLSYPMEVIVGNVVFWLIFMFIPPLLTMRLLAEERGSGTLEMLLTAPIRDWQVVAAKFLACYGFYLVLLVPTLAYLPVLTDARLETTAIADAPLMVTGVYVALAVLVAVALAFGLMMTISSFREGELASALMGLIISILLIGLVGFLVWPMITQSSWWTFQCQIDPGPVWTTYLGLVLAGAMFIAIGLLISSLVTSQMIAAIISLAIGVLFVAGMWLPEIDTSGLAFRVLAFFTVPRHFERDFSRGLIDTRHLILYGSVTLFCLFLTVRSLEKRR